MRKNLFWMLLTIVFIFNIAMAGVGTAESKPVISMDPKDNTAEPGEEFTVDLNIVDISGDESLYGWQVKITFKPSIVNVINATEGPFLSAYGYETFWGEPAINNTEGFITVGGMLMVPFPPTGVNGSGTLATITLEAVSRGATSLKFEDTELFTVKYNNVVTIPHDAEDGYFANGAGGGISLELVAGVVIAVAICSFAAFYYMRRRASAKA